jgi:hypothetical protein
VCYPAVGGGRIAKKGCATMFDRLIDAVLIFGFPFGVLVGYMWRAPISRARRDRYLAERSRGRPVMQEPAPTRAPRCAIDSDLGVDHQTADVIRAKLEDGREIPHQAEVIANDGVSQPRKKRAKAARKPRASKAAPL